MARPSRIVQGHLVCVVKNIEQCDRAANCHWHVTVDHGSFCSSSDHWTGSPHVPAINCACVPGSATANWRRRHKTKCRVSVAKRMPLRTRREGSGRDYAHTNLIRKSQFCLLLSPTIGGQPVHTIAGERERVGVVELNQPISYGARWGRVWKALASESPTISCLAGSQVSLCRPNRIAIFAKWQVESAR